MATNFLVVMRMTEQLSRPLRRAASAANQMSAASNRLNTQLAATNGVMIGLAAATNATIGVMSASAASLETALARLETVTRPIAGTVQTALKDAESSAREFSTQFAVSAKEIIDAQFQIATAGVAVSEQVIATQSAFKLATATQGDFIQSAQLLGSFLNTFGRSAQLDYLAPAEKMARLTDVLSSAVQRFQVTLPVLAEGFKFVTGPASTLNLKFEEVSAALGILNTAGFRGSLAGTALSNMFNKLDRAVEKLNLNPDKFIDLNGNLKDMASFLDEVNRALADKTPIEQQNKLIEVFDIRAGRVIKTLLNNIDTLKRFTSELEVSQGATEKMSNILNNTATAAFKRMYNSVQNIVTIVGGTLNKELGPIARFFTEIASSVAGFVERNKTLITTLVALGVTLVSVSSSMLFFASVAGRTSGAIAALAASSRTAQIALLPFRGIGLIFRSLFTLTGLFATGLVAAAAGVAYASKKIVDELMGVDSASKRTYETIAQLNSQWGNSIERTGRFASELKRLASTIKNNIDFPLGKDESFGNLPFAQVATQTKRDDPTVTRAEAIKRAAQAAGGFTGIVRELSDALNQGSRTNALYAQKFEEIRSATDRTFSSLDAVGKAFEFSESKIRASELVLRSLSGGSEQAEKSIAKLLSIYDKLGATIDGATRGGLRRDAFDSIVASLDSLRGSPSAGLKEIVKLFDEARLLAKSTGSAFEFATKEITQSGLQLRQLSADSTEFAKLVLRDSGFKGLESLKSQFDSLTGKALVLKESLRSIETAISQTGSSAKSINNQFKNASLGGESFAKAMKTSAEQLVQAERSFQSITNATKFLRESIESVKDTPIANTDDFKKAKKFVEDIGQIEIDLRTKIDEAQAIREANRIFAIIDSQNKSFTAQQVKDIKSLGSAFSQTIGSALTNGLKNQSPFKALSDSFKQHFVNQIQGEIGLLFGNKFKDQIRESINTARKIIEQAELSGSLLSGLESGDLARKINSAIQSAIPGIKQITGGDIFNIEANNKLAEQFGNIFTDASVAMVNAGNRSAAILRNLQSVIGNGPASDVSGLREQATQLRSLLQQAGTTGARDAIRPVEEALSAVLTQLRQGGAQTAVQQIATATQLSTQAISASAGVFATAVASLAPAAQGFIAIIEEGFKRVATADLGQAAKSVVDNFGTQSKRQLSIEIKSEGSKLDVNVSSAGGSTVGLDEDEIRQIVDQAKTGLLQELDEKINRLENELRNR